MAQITRSINEAIRTGLIRCWETGHELAQSKPELAEEHWQKSMFG